MHKGISWLLLVVFLGLGFLLALQMKLGDAQDKIQSYFTMWETEITTDLISRGRTDILEKLIESSQDLGGRVIKVDAMQVPVAWQAKSQDPICLGQQSINLQFNNIPSVEVAYCISLSWLVEKTLFSASFIFFLLLILIPALLYGQIQVRNRAQVLDRFLDYLEQRIPGNLIQPSSPLESRLIENYQRTIKLKQESLVLQARANNSEGIAEISRQVAHDLRSPLSALQILADSVPELHREKQEMLKMGVDRVAEITSDLMGRSRESLKSLQQEICFPYPALELLQVEKGLQYPKVKLQMHVKKGEDMQLWQQISVPLSNAMFNRIFSNLIDNAVESYQDLSAPPSVDVFLERQEKFLLISIKDYGKGIAADVQSQLFAKGASFGKEDGTGLGLYGAKKELERIKGEIQLLSAIDSGTTISVRLPIV